MSSTASSNRGWIVALSGTGINLALGVLYAWSTIKKEFPAEWGWTDFQKALPYTIACLMFAFMMVPAGRLQDKYGPRVVASVGGVLTGLGIILASQFTTSAYPTNLIMFIVGFGMLAGSGIGFGYASATPPAVKWFPPAKTGMIAGIVVAGFGLASAYISPLVKYMIGAFNVKDEAGKIVTSGVPNTMLILGIAFLIVVVALSQMLVNPPAPAQAPKPAGGGPAPAAAVDFSIPQMVKTPAFIELWIMYAINAGAGLMIIGQLASLVKDQAKTDAGFILVALLAVGNAGGRVLAGTLSDKLGRVRTLQIFTALQCAFMFITPFVGNLYGLVFCAMAIGMNYGSNLALFPAFTKDFFGLKNFGVNYGMVFTAWGIGSLMALLAGKIKDAFGSYQYALFIAGGLLVLTFIISFLVKKPATPASSS